MPEQRPPKICDYEGSNYRTEFWEGQGRNYEDRVERVALRRLLPSHGTRLLELGAGFGRLTDEYANYDQVVLLDYSLSQLQYAQELHGQSDRLVYVAADIYKLPFRPGIFDAATMIRVIHHISDVEKVLKDIHRVIAPGGTFILEHANKQNIKAILRYAMGKQNWNPNSLEPIEFVELNFDFHPTYILQQLSIAGFKPNKRIPVSFFRLGSIKQFVPNGLLVTLDGLLQYTGILYTPSIFVRSTAVNSLFNNVDTLESIFICPETGQELTREGNTLVCKDGSHRYAIRDGIYDFKAPLDET